MTLIEAGLPAWALTLAAAASARERLISPAASRQTRGRVGRDAIYDSFRNARSTRTWNMERLRPPTVRIEKSPRVECRPTHRVICLARRPMPTGWFVTTRSGGSDELWAPSAALAPAGAKSRYRLSRHPNPSAATAPNARSEPHVRDPRVVPTEPGDTDRSVRAHHGRRLRGSGRRGPRGRLLAQLPKPPVRGRVRACGGSRRRPGDPRRTSVRRTGHRSPARARGERRPAALPR